MCWFKVFPWFFDISFLDLGFGGVRVQDDWRSDAYTPYLSFSGMPEWLVIYSVLKVPWTTWGVSLLLLWLCLLPILLPLLLLLWMIIVVLAKDVAHVSTGLGLGGRPNSYLLQLSICVILRDVHRIQETIKWNSHRDRYQKQTTGCSPSFLYGNKELDNAARLNFWMSWEIASHNMP